MLKSSYSRSHLIEETEKALTIWMEEFSQQRIPVNGNLIKERALRFYRRLKNLKPSLTVEQARKTKFSASTGWLSGFLKRHAFHNVKITDEVASADAKFAQSYPEKLCQIIKDGRYCPNQVFNADETGWFWKKMSNRTYIAKSERTASGFKAAKDRVTFLLCGNASGDIISKHLLVNRSLRPRALKGKDIQKLPVHWMANKRLG